MLSATASRELGSLTGGIEERVGAGAVVVVVLDFGVVDVEVVVGIVSFVIGGVVVLVMGFGVELAVAGLGLAPNPVPPTIGPLNHSSPVFAFESRALF